MVLERIKALIRGEISLKKWLKKMLFTLILSKPWIAIFNKTIHQLKSKLSWSFIFYLIRYIIAISLTLYAIGKFLLVSTHITVEDKDLLLKCMLSVFYGYRFRNVRFIFSDVFSLLITLAIIFPILSLTMSILYFLFSLCSNIFLEGFVFMTNHGGSSDGSGISGGNSSGGPSGGGPGGPAVTGNPGSSGDSGTSVNPITVKSTAEILNEFKSKHPDCTWPAGATEVMDPELDHSDSGYFFKGNKDKNYYSKYYNNSYHNNPIRVFGAKNAKSYSFIHPAHPLPNSEGFFWKTSKDVCPVDFQNPAHVNKTLYLKNAKGELVEFPLKMLPGIKKIQN
jgi:hypothetical protein